MTDIQNVTAWRLSERFSLVLRDWLTPGEFQEMVRRNRLATKRAGVCHSHDFCDANMAMDAAWREVVGTEIDADDEAQAALWSEAWELAHSRGLIA